MNEEWLEYERLRDLVLDGRADQDEIRQLERLVLSSEQMRRNYAENAHLAASLSWAVDAKSGSEPNAIPENSDGGRSRRNRLWGLAALAAALLLSISAFTYFETSSEQSFATIASTKDCRWGESSLPTAKDSHVGAGRLRLLSGLATLRFPKVNVTLEGPADFEVLGADHCRVHAGRVLTRVEEGGEGFVMETPTATLVDRGTVFGVNVLASGASDLRVFQGEVDVDHLKSGKQATVTTDGNLRISDRGLKQIPESVETQFDQQRLAPIQTIQISTAIGSGDDVYLSPQPHPPESASEVALLVKRPPGKVWGGPWRRKAFLRFDLSLLPDVGIEDATLQLHGVATDIGFASLIPDATFLVYGLTDESQDRWDSATVTWATSPAQQGDDLDVNENQTRLLGSFVVPQSEPTGRFDVSGDALVQFLQNDTNGIATLILVAETSGEGAAYVHGFASRTHPDLPAPTLRIRIP